MTDINSQHARGLLTSARRQARAGGQRHRAQLMLMAAGLSAGAIVAVAAAMMVSLG